MDETTQSNVITNEELETPQSDFLQVADAPQSNEEALVAQVNQAQQSAQSDFDSAQESSDSEAQLVSQLMGQTSDGMRDAFAADLREGTAIAASNERLNQITQEILSMPKLTQASKFNEELRTKGTADTKKFLNRRLNSLDKRAAIDTLLLSAESDILANNVNAAESKIQAAVDAKFGPLEAELEVREFNLGRLDAALERSETKLTEAQKNQFEIQKDQVAQERKDMDVLKNLGVQIATNQAPAGIRSEAFQAETLSDFMAIPGIEKYLTSPLEKVNLQIARANLNKINNESNMNKGPFVNLDMKTAISEDARLKKEESYQKIDGSRNAAAVISKFEELWESTDGNITLAGDDYAQLKSAYTDVLLTIKEEPYNLGVLNGPDLDVMHDLIMNPTILSTFRAGSEGVTNSINNLQSSVAGLVTQQMTSIENSYGKYNPEQVGSLKTTREWASEVADLTTPKEEKNAASMEEDFNAIGGGVSQETLDLDNFIIQ